MKYLIANKVVYDTESGELTIPGSELAEAQKLTHTANSILSLLIASPGKVLERQYLLKEVWESAGHTGSSSSLNQYISILRKTLTSLADIEESIIVVPKVGFYFSTDIDVKLLEQPYVPLADISQAHAIATQKTMLFNYIAAGFIIFALAVANLWAWNPPISHARYSSLNDIGTLEKCTVKTFENLSHDAHTRLYEVLLSAQPDLKDKCQKNAANLLVNIQTSIFYGGRGRIFYSFCPLNSENNTLAYCENHYAFNWKLK